MKRTASALLATAAAVLITLAGCGGLGTGNTSSGTTLNQWGSGNRMSGSSNTQTGSSPSDPLSTRSADRSNAMGFRLAATLHVTGHSNTVLSPPSIGAALGMLTTGAGGETAKQLRQVQGLGDKDVPQDLLIPLQRDSSDIALSTANSLWLRTDIKAEKKWVNGAKRQFQAAVENLSGNTQADVAAINAWAKRATRQMIDKLLDSLGQDTVAVLMNAVFFKGIWQQPFDKAATADGLWRPSSGEPMTVPFMHDQRRCRVAEVEGVTALTLPLGKPAKDASAKTGEFAAVLVLPKEGVGLNEYVKDLTPERWRQLLQAGGLQQCQLVVPRLKLDMHKSLVEPLQQMGVTHAFQASSADFSGIAKQRLVVTQVVHRAVVEMDEEGAKAAAATGIAVELTSVQVPRVLRFDRPFLFTIVDQKSGLVIFMALVEKPVDKRVS